MAGKKNQQGQQQVPREAKNIDDLLLSQPTQEQVAQHVPEVGKPPEVQPQEEVGNQEDNEQVNKEVLEQSNVNQQDETYLPEEGSQHEQHDNAQHEDDSKINNDTQSEKQSPIDEYGNPIEKPRLYTEEELNQRIRDRLSRGRYAQEEQQQQQQWAQQQRQQQGSFTQQQVQQAQADGFQHDPNSEETWDQQLRTFMNQVLDEREAKRAEDQWRYQETQRQAEFESKFSAGMSKYNDFHKVVAGKPITDSMMLATRNLENPASFVYAASKLHPQELERISKIGDPYAQAAEVGRLHERMVKDRKAVTKAPRPLKSPSGDVPGRVIPHQPSIDQRIHDYGKQKRK